MSYTQAIADGFSKYVQFSGRSSRSAYWWWALFAFVVGAVTYGIGAAIGTMVLYYIATLALLLPGIAVGVRRLHDTGRSGWWYLIVFVPVIGGFVLLFFFIQPSGPANEYGAAPDGAPGAEVTL
ncbi:MAG: DUF805 domain-containing protein [Solirubrobacteraceae bacterium]|nr:DUF805 domain-containing protein [Solirubrobacteraceae bacterium]